MKIFPRVGRRLFSKKMPQHASLVRVYITKVPIDKHPHSGLPIIERDRS